MSGFCVRGFHRVQHGHDVRLFVEMNALRNVMDFRVGVINIKKKSRLVPAWRYCSGVRLGAIGPGFWI